MIDCVTLYKFRKLSVPVHHLQHEEDGTYFLHCSEESRANTHKVLITGLALSKACWLFLVLCLLMPTYVLLYMNFLCESICKSSAAFLHCSVTHRGMADSTLVGLGKGLSSLFFSTLILYLIWPSVSKLLSFQHVINIKIINDIFTFFFILILQNLVCILLLSVQLRLATFQMLSRHMGKGAKPHM